jgi:hypothetical protein
MHTFGLIPQGKVAGSAIVVEMSGTKLVRYPDARAEIHRIKAICATE